ncbi:proline racemase [Rheinheimera riviphila]|uniref:Proline racemase n=1 Tax=Rheinheimera riviphila TaxID=1834037 RepID=A0A437R008_9GAMM|nr:proline racemase family protein [Rheinheimera riviphila]RVU40112.1 proline racemase [Rheinheimera riviphila]
MQSFQRFAKWQPPLDHKASSAAPAVEISTLDCHTGGEPLRIITAGFPELQGDSVLARRRDCQQRFDGLRRALMWEPRGHADMYGCIIVSPERADSEFGVIFLHNEGYSTMCGHAMIALAKVAVEAGVVPMTEPVTSFAVDAPCGQIRLFAEVKQGRVQHCWFHNVPSFVVASDQPLHLPGIGDLRYTLAYGGAFYAYVDAASIGLSLAASNHRQIIDLGQRIKLALAAQIELQHPFEPDLNFLYGTIFYGAPLSSGAPLNFKEANHPANTTSPANMRNVCVFADGELDRSPTGSGVSGLAAILQQQGQLAVGESLVIESILGSQFQLSIVDLVQYGRYPAVIPRVQGQAYVTGRQQFYLDPQDPFAEGFIFR